MSYLNTLNSLINDKLNNIDGLNSESAFTLICSDYLQESSLIPEFQQSYFFKDGPNNQNLKINGFCLNDDEDVLTLFITEYSSEANLTSLNQKQIEVLFKQLYRVLNFVIRVNESGVPKANILSELHQSYTTKLKPQIIQIDFYLLTNNKAVNRKEVNLESIFDKSDLNSSVDFNLRIVDIVELERLHKNNQEINIPVADFYNKPINVIKPNLGSSSYGTAIAIFPGEFLYNIYKEFQGRLLESNVRSFLSSKVKVNKGISKTLTDSPGMFLAYNNGLCVTVSKIEMNSDGTVKEFKNFQIVNGGQTTSSIYFSKKKNKEIHLEYVNVMAKITELSRNIDSKKIQNTIAINSNLQNAVKNSDLSSNEEFLKNLHSCSKKFRNPKTNNYYYFERTRGQYKLERDLVKDERKFTSLYPNKNVIDKSILSVLFFCAYKEEFKPYIAVQSAEKRYPILNLRMDEENKYISENYFIRIAGSFILYDFLESTYGTGNNAVGKIRKNVIAYSISLLQHKLMKVKKSIDFAEIWKKGIDIKNTLEFKNYLKYVNAILLDNLNDGRLDEACKKEESWDLILKKADEKQLNAIINFLPVCVYQKEKQSNSDMESAISDKHKLMIEEINKIIYSPERYNKLIGRIDDEMNQNSADGMSLYSRSHREIIRSHFQPNGKLTEINPKSHASYLNKIQKSDGTLVKSKLSEINKEIEELFRIFEAILKDELLVL